MSTARKPNSRAPRNRHNGRTPRPGRPGDGPIEVIKVGGDGTHDREYADLFELDGKMYQIWLNPPANIGLRYLKITRMQGEAAAAQYLMETMLGEDGYDALADCDELTDDQFEQVMKACEKHALGRKEAKGGKR